MPRRIVRKSLNAPLRANVYGVRVGVLAQRGLQLPQQLALVCRPRVPGARGNHRANVRFYLHDSRACAQRPFGPVAHRCGTMSRFCCHRVPSSVRVHYATFFPKTTPGAPCAVYSYTEDVTMRFLARKQTVFISPSCTKRRTVRGEQPIISAARLNVTNCALLSFAYCA